MTTSNLSATRTKDRSRMAQLVTELAESLGCTVERQENTSYRPRGIRLDLRAPGGVCVGVELDGGRRNPETYVLSWHMAYDEPAKLSPHFWANINTVHYGKATDVAASFDQLLNTLRYRLTGAKDGSAYQRAAVPA